MLNQPIATISTIPARIETAMNVRSCRRGVEFSTRLTRKKSLEFRCKSKKEVWVSKSSVSPCCNTISPIFFFIRSPLRATAITTAL